MVLVHGSPVRDHERAPRPAVALSGVDDRAGLLEVHDHRGHLLGSISVASGQPVVSPGLEWREAQQRERQAVSGANSTVDAQCA